MTPECEDVRARLCPFPADADLSRLFGDAPVSAVEGAGGGAEGVGAADDRGTGARPLHGGARPGWPTGVDDEQGWLDREHPGVRGERPASRDELASLILRYREEQASRQSRRRMPETSRPRFTSEQRLLILDSWLRSKLPAGDFAPLVGMSLHTLRAWNARFAEFGPAGLDDKPLGRPMGSRLSEATKRAILLMKEEHKDWGQDRIAAMLLRPQGFSASASAIGRVLEEAGYVAAADPRKAHGQEPKHFLQRAVSGLDRGAKHRADARGPAGGELMAERGRSHRRSFETVRTTWPLFHCGVRCLPSSPSIAICLPIDVRMSRVSFSETVG